MVQLLKQDRASLSRPPTEAVNNEEPESLRITPFASPVNIRQLDESVDAKYEGDVNSVARLEDDLQFLLFWVKSKC